MSWRILATASLLLAPCVATAGNYLPDIRGPQDPAMFIDRENALRRAINDNFLLNNINMLPFLQPVNNTVDPTFGGDFNNRFAAKFNCSYTIDNNVNTGFTDSNCMEIILNPTWGLNSYGGGTNAKFTYIPLLLAGNMTAAGQRFLLTEEQNCYGMGDCFGESKRITFASANISGDEGTGFQSVSYLQQQANLVLAAVSGTPTRSACNTTTTQLITGSKNSQTVTVANTTGCVVGDWLVIQTQLPTGSPNHEPVQVTAIGANSITGVFRLNHSNGVTVTPALVLPVNSTGQFGQGRVLVNLSGASYSTGTVASISGGGLTGSGTTWSGGMVGDNGTTSIGCVYLDADTYTGAPFSGGGSNGPLHSWYQIIAPPSSATAMGIFSYSTGADTSYHGYGPGSGGYLVKPCAEVLHINGNQIILATNGATWSNGDSVELAIPPYPDVSAHQEFFSTYTAGGVSRRAYRILNTGARTFGTAIEIDGSMATGGNSDSPWAWGVGESISGAKTGISIIKAKDYALEINDGFTGSSLVRWIGSQPGMLGTIQSPTGGFYLDGIQNNTPTLGRTGTYSITKSDGTHPWHSFVGRAAVQNDTSGLGGGLRFFRLDSTGGDPQAATNYIDLFYAYNSNNRLIVRASDAGTDYFTINPGTNQILSGVSFVPSAGIATPSGQVLAWNADVGLSRLAAGSVALGNGTQGDFTGSLKIGTETLTAAAPTVAAAQIGLGGTTAAAANCNSGGAITPAACMVINVAGTTRYLPYF